MRRVVFAFCCCVLAAGCGDDVPEMEPDAGNGPSMQPDSGGACVGAACDRPDADEGPDVLAPLSPACGDGTRDEDEGCDDGNTDSGDGCSADCTIEATCGDGTMDPGEGCDDGNLDRGDGCSPSCAVEASCGDGRVDPGEECDDGDANSDTSADACRTTCVRPRCGDGVTDEGEACDDGEGNSDTAADACRVACVRPSCGDGVRDASEACDTGDARSDTTSDACRTACTLPRCGDSVRDTGEACDDGNASNDDECHTDCSLASCGDGRMDPGEECDDANNTSGDGCQANCLLPACGDSVEDEGEECDDGNVLDGDGCQADCTDSECIADSGCDDGAYCNGPEVCRAGVCTPGIAPSLDDGIVCTNDSCDEAENRVLHRPYDPNCSGLNGPNECATTGPNAGRLVRTAGICDARLDCQTVVAVVDDCLDDTLHPTTYSCGTGPTSVHRHEGICVAGATAACGSTDDVADDCTDMLPANACNGTAAAGNLQWTHGAVGTCGAASGMPTCGVTQTTTDCDPQANTCAMGQLTRYTETCAAGTGCGNSAQTPTACPTSATTCATVAGVPNRRTFSPSCASGSACSTTGTSTDTPCTAPGPSCTTGTLTTTTPTCSGGTCGTTSSSSTCPTSATTCATVAGVPNRRTFSPSCTSGSACSTTGTATDTPCTAAGPSCTSGMLTTRTPTCSAGTCGSSSSTSTCPTSPGVCVTLGASQAFVGSAPDCDSATACDPDGEPQTAVACTDPPDMCSSATLTRITPTCSPTSGCGTNTQAPTPCPDTPSTCTVSPASGNPILTTYTPTCATSSTCGTTTNTTTCTTTQYTCDANVFNYWQPTCNATTESCGRTNIRSSDCNLNRRTCEFVPGTRLARVRIETGTCSTTTGCGVSTSFESCSTSRSVCLDANRLLEYTGECGSGQCQTRIVTCAFGCAGGMCIIG